MTDDCADDLAAARDRFASAALAGAVAPDSNRLGTLTLRAHQRAAVARLVGILARYRGALLADAVGLGKTYVALAIARQHRKPLLLCPASLRPMWQRAMSAACVQLPLVGIEALARGERIGVDPDLIVIDEAHHLRTPTTRRYEIVAGLARRSRVLLLSATPLHNSRCDLTSLLALFLGSSVHAWSDAEIARVIVRRDEKTADQLLPSLVGPEPLTPCADDDCLDALCALPLAVPAADEGTAAALATITLVHLWASSRAALVASLRSRRAKAVALRDAIASGHLPTAAELAAWHYADDTLQLAFPFCVSDASAPIESTAIARQLDEYSEATTSLLEHLRSTPDPDDARAALLRAVREAHPAARIVAFSQYAQTIIALGRRLRGDRRVAVLTSTGGRIASGPITRQDILDQFAGDATPVTATERIDLLLSTDLLSEGVDLRGASVIVNLDLPWNPARIEQRIGRTRRMGSPYTTIHAYTFVPPAAAERMLDLQRRLSSKIHIAQRVIGESSITPPPLIDATTAPVVMDERLRSRLSPWLDPIRRRDSAAHIVAAVDSDTDAWIAVVHLDGIARFLCSTGGGVDDNPAAFLDLVDRLGPAVAADERRAAAAIGQITRWMSTRRLEQDIGLAPGYPSVKRAVLERLSRVVARAPRHRQPAVLAAAGRARAGVSAVTGIGAERVLEALVRSPADDDAWIESVEAFGTLHGSIGADAGARAGARAGDEDTAVGAIVLLQARAVR